MVSCKLGKQSSHERNLFLEVLSNVFIVYEI